LTLHNCITMHGTKNIKIISEAQLRHCYYQNPLFDSTVPPFHSTSIRPDTMYSILFLFLELDVCREVSPPPPPPFDPSFHLRRGPAIATLKHQLAIVHRQVSRCVTIVICFSRLDPNCFLTQFRSR